MAAYGLLTMYNLSAQIGTSFSPGASEEPGTWTYAELGDGIDNIAEALNEVVQQYFFLNNGGYATNHVTGMAPTFTMTGRRVLGDPAQEFIFGTKYDLDTARQTNLKLSWSNGEEPAQTTTLTVNCTICNMQEWSGATTDDSAISFEVRFDEKPNITQA